MKRHTKPEEHHAHMITDRLGNVYEATSVVSRQRCQLVLSAKQDSVGHATMHRQQPSVLRLADLYIDTPYRNKGLGKQLIKLMHALALDQGCTTIEGTVALRDVRAAPYLLAWLARQGFAIVPRPAHHAVAADIILPVRREGVEGTYWRT